MVILAWPTDHDRKWKTHHFANPSQIAEVPVTVEKNQDMTVLNFAQLSTSTFAQYRDHYNSTQTRPTKGHKSLKIRVSGAARDFDHFDPIGSMFGIFTEKNRITFNQIFR